jgi:3-oxoacyl-[acyl-carrier-protein] synthase II
MDRATAMAMASARQAVADARAESIAASPRTGVYWGTGMGSAGTMEDAYREAFGAGNWRLKPTTVVTAMNNASAAQISLEFGVTGPNLTYSVACASSAIAIGEALRAIRHGFVDRAIVGGSDALLTKGSLAAWAALRALAHTDPEDAARSCKPFAEDRSGFVLGEGGCALFLERVDAAHRRGARIYAELAGYGLSADATHIADPSTEGQVRALRAALEDAGSEPDDVGYINAHGTATFAGDRVEVASIERIFSGASRQVAVSSTKAIHGHVMGATGAIEFMIAVMSLGDGRVPPTAHLRRRDPLFALDFVAGPARRIAGLSCVLSNSFAFGGTNAVLIARAHPAVGPA